MLSSLYYDAYKIKYCVAEDKGVYIFTDESELILTAIFQMHL